MAARHGVEVLDYSKDVVTELQEMTQRGADSILVSMPWEWRHTDPRMRRQCRQ